VPIELGEDGVVVDVKAPKEPTAEACSANEPVEMFDGRPAFACWYPQMGGYVAKAVVAPGGIDDCFDMWIWHDGAFPFSEDQEPHKKPAALHHCCADQFVAFGNLVMSLQEKCAADQEKPE
jgi:hypothetical protein